MPREGIKICATPDCGAKVVNMNPDAALCPICYGNKQSRCQQCGRPGLAGDGSTGLCPRCLDTEELLNSTDRRYRE